MHTTFDLIALEQKHFPRPVFTKTVLRKMAQETRTIMQEQTL
jgi:hypothetical protein